MRAVTVTNVNRDEEGRAEGTDYNYETKCLGRRQRGKRQEEGTLAGTNFVTVGQGALRLKRPVGDVAANVKHRWKE